MKVFVVGSALHYANFIKDVELVDNMEDAEVVLFTGGEDVDPSLYGKEKHSTTRSNIIRDRAEKEVFDKVRPDQVCLGICRGSQFLCVMNGGLLVQDCENHALYTTHRIMPLMGNTMYHITSTHHQMQYPYNLYNNDYHVLYVSERRSHYYEGDGIDEDTIRQYGEPEIVAYHVDGKPNCLAVQGHPEMIPESPVCDEINDLLIQALHNEGPWYKIK